MKVLVLPHNVASWVSTTVRALRSIGVDARGLVRNNSIYADASATQAYEVAPRTQWLRTKIQHLLWARAVLSAIRWADVVHWIYGLPALKWNLGLRFAARLRRPRFVTFAGADLRVTDVAARDNPYLLEALQQGRVPHSDRTGPDAMQELFARHGFRALLCRHELLPYLRQGLFPRACFVRSPIPLDELRPAYPSPARLRPRIVHCPTRKGTKGSSHVLAAVERLERRCELEFELLHGVDRATALDRLRAADLVVDQVIIGEYGNVSLEAMALGKPTICYIKPSVLERQPPDFPIVNATPRTLERVLEGLVKNPRRRHEIGVQSRAYMERHHEPRAVARELVAAYESFRNVEQAPRPRSASRRGGTGQATPTRPRLGDGPHGARRAAPGPAQ